MYKNQKGFTLIELLIVIVIIGILAGVLIAIIDPTQQQSRARDAGLQASINKIALSAQGFISAYGRSPDDVEFFQGLSNATAEPTAGNCTTGAADGCTFTITGNPGPVLCTSTANWNVEGAPSFECNYHYERDAGGTLSTFTVAVKSHGVAGKWFVYDNTVGTMQQCDADLTSNCISL